jgi:hypothetical protein
MLTAKEARQITDEVRMQKELKKLEKKIQDAAEKGYTHIKTKGDKSKQFWCHVKNLGFSVHHEKPRETEKNRFPQMETYVSWPCQQIYNDADVLEELS